MGQYIFREISTPEELDGVKYIRTKPLKINFGKNGVAITVFKKLITKNNTVEYLIYSDGVFDTKKYSLQNVKEYIYAHQPASIVPAIEIEEKQAEVVSHGIEVETTDDKISTLKEIKKAIRLDLISKAIMFIGTLAALALLLYVFYTNILNK